MIWMEGFDGPGTVAALATKISFSDTSNLSLVDPLTGTGKALTCTGAGADRTATIAYGAVFNDVYLHCKIKWSKSVANYATTTPLFEFNTGSLVQSALQLSTNGTLLEAKAGTTIVLATAAVSPDTIYSLRVYLLVADSGGRFVVSLNGTTVIDYTGDTQGRGIPGMDNVKVRLAEYDAASARTDFTYDHLVISDSEIPDCNIVTLRPTADGNYTQFTPSTGTDHFALVDEATLDTADFNASSTAGHRDSFKFTEPLISGDIVGVAMEAFVDKSDAGARAVRHFVRQGGTDYDGAADLALTEAGNIASRYYEVNPATSAAFTVAELTGASRTEFGVKVQS